MAINKVIVIGNLGANPVLRALPSGQNVANFSLATTERFTDRNGMKQERTDWHRIVAFGRLADTCERSLSKGRQVVCCESFIGDGGGPPGVGLQEQIPNHPKLRG
jgi:single-strand DNA-binding protein